MFRLTKGKIVKKMMAGIMAAVVCFGTFSVATPCSAATTSITATRTDSMIQGKFIGKRGTVLKIILIYREKNKKDSNITREDHIQNIMTGDYDTVSASRKVSSGYKYTYLLACGYENGNMKAVVER